MPFLTLCAAHELTHSSHLLTETAVLRSTVKRYLPSQYISLVSANSTSDFNYMDAVFELESHLTAELKSCYLYYQSLLSRKIQLLP